MSAKTEAMHRKLSRIVYGTEAYAHDLSARWNAMTRPERKMARQRINEAIAEHDRTKLALALGKSLVADEPKRF